MTTLPQGGTDQVTADVKIDNHTLVRGKGGALVIVAANA